MAAARAKELGLDAWVTWYARYVEHDLVDRHWPTMVVKIGDERARAVRDAVQEIYFSESASGAESVPEAVARELANLAQRQGQRQTGAPLTPPPPPPPPSTSSTSRRLAGNRNRGRDRNLGTCSQTCARRR